MQAYCWFEHQVCVCVFVFECVKAQRNAGWLAGYVMPIYLSISTTVCIHCNLHPGSAAAR